MEVIIGHIYISVAAWPIAHRYILFLKTQKEMLGAQSDATLTTNSSDFDEKLRRRSDPQGTSFVCHPHHLDLCSSSDLTTIDKRKDQRE